MSSSTSSASSAGSAVVKTGVFLDGPVINIGYKTETQQGLTNHLGEYKYIEGERVTFFIGDLELPSVVAMGLVTPLELVGVNDVENTTVVNILRLLQTLDEDGNPENGVTITELAKANAQRVDFGLPEKDFESSLAVNSLILNGGQYYETKGLVQTLVAIEHFKLSLGSGIRINMQGRTATSKIINSDCPNIPGGYEYTFTDSAITMIGSDAWDNSGDVPCRLASIDKTTVTPQDFIKYGSDSALHCADYPTCTTSDFERSVSGVDVDGRKFTTTSSFDPNRLIIRHVKKLIDDEGKETTFTEEIYIESTYKHLISMSGKNLTSVMISSVCPGKPGGFKYSFANSDITMTGTDGWNSKCVLGSVDTFTVPVADIVDVYKGDFAFNCRKYPVCEIAELKREVSGVDVDGRKFHSFSRFNRATSVLTYTKVVLETDSSESVTFIEEFNFFKN